MDAEVGPLYHHLLVYGNEDHEVIPRSLQLVAGRTAQAYNYYFGCEMVGLSTENSLPWYCFPYI